MRAKLVADSAANFSTDSTLEVTYVPLKIRVGKEEFTDDCKLEIPKLLAAMDACRETSGTACPGIGDWLNAFEGSDEILGISITGALSGSYNSGIKAAEIYQKQNPGAKVFILDSLSTGPEMQLILEEYRDCINAGMDFESTVSHIKEYRNNTRLLFCLGSLKNLAKNGRVNPLLAKMGSILGIRVVGQASNKGTLELLHKCHGEKNAIRQIVRSVISSGCKGGKFRISHTENLPGASALAEQLFEIYPESDITVTENRGLCSFYSERKGLILGYTAPRPNY